VFERREFLACPKVQRHFCVHANIYFGAPASSPIYNRLNEWRSHGRHPRRAMNLPFPSQLTPPEVVSDEKNIAEIEAKLRRLERRDWWLWSMAVIVMLLLTFAVFSMSFPNLIKVDDPFFQSSLDSAVRGLIGLVLLFNAYTIYQQVTVKRLRRQFSKQLSEMRTLHMRAEEYQRLALIDPLTGLCNRRMAEDRLAAEASRSRRYGHPLTVVSLDLDNFKRINDTHGHPVGDLVLKEFARRLGSAVRLSDFAARMGGDEFLVLLPECPTSHVDLLLSRLRPMNVEYDNQKIPICFSAGWVGYEPGETTEEFLARADRTLYAEKRAGKSRAKEPAVVH
jgi:diguanylate cyclase (GGDEF)-like protein